jgi:hypothetical protein
MTREIGENARAWKGEKAGYVAKHLWIIKHHGKASECIKCDSKTAKRYEWANISGEYKRDFSDYMPLCPPCHRRLDKGNYCRKGHEYTNKNTRVSKQGWRVCRKCQAITNHQYRQRKRCKIEK